MQQTHQFQSFLIFLLPIYKVWNLQSFIMERSLNVVVFVKYRVILTLTKVINWNFLKKNLSLNLVLIITFCTYKSKKVIPQSNQNMKNCQTQLYRTASDGPNLFVITGVCYNRVELCAKWLFGTGNFVHKNRVRYNRVSL